MPTYQYNCNRCDYKYKKKNTEPTKVCPKCGSWLLNHIIKEKKGKK